MGEISIEKIIALTIPEVIKGFYSSIVGLKEAQKAQFISSFAKYVENNCHNLSVAKTLLSQDTQVKLSDVFVKPDLSFDRKIIDLPEVCNINIFYKRIILSATAGAGKSFLSKYIYLEIVKKRKDVVPFFVEFRKLNSNNCSIKEQICNDLSFFNLELTEKILLNCLATGKFILILDGYDELEISRRKKIDEEILEMSTKLTEMSILITTRPQEEIRQWTSFRTLKVEALSKEKASSLVNKLKFDTAVKKKFVRDLEKTLYDQHTEFLSNPLLLTIMLITYSDNAEIPDKIHLFYEKAFDALFSKHDVSKDLYKRDKFSNLRIDDFKSLLSTFSLITYLQRKIEFSESQLDEFLNNSIELFGQNVDSEAFKEDLLKSVCILTRDGVFYTYTHRSFQEYFSAFYLKSVSRRDRSSLLKKIAEEGRWDSTLTLYFEMDRDNMERDLIIPYLEQLIQDLGKKTADNEAAVHHLKKSFSGISIEYYGTINNKKRDRYLASYTRNSGKNGYGEDGEFYVYIQDVIDVCYQGIYPHIFPAYPRLSSDDRKQKLLERSNTIEKIIDKYNIKLVSDNKVHKEFESIDFNIDDDRSIMICKELGFINGAEGAITKCRFLLDELQKRHLEKKNLTRSYLLSPRKKKLKTK